jgi:prepilin-type N-terminal cleavage/methylation domain-containing protein
MRKHINKKGFSIIEIMAVIFIVTVGMVGMLTLVYQSIKVQRFNKHTLIAYQLAQEGIELVRVIRDNNWQASERQGLDTVLPSGSYCLDYNNITINTGSEDYCELFLNDLDLYTHTTTSQRTPYTRTIEISPIVGYEGEAVLVSVEITWQESGGTMNYIAETKLFDWY